MHRPIGPIACAVLLLAGCSVLEDQPTMLVGSWGGPDMQVVGTPDDATVILPCQQASLPTGLRLDQRSGFIATGTITAPTDVAGRPIRFIVTYAHDTASLNVQTLYQGAWGGNDVYTVVRGQPISYPAGRVCSY